MTMIREEQPKPGSFDWMLNDIEETVWRDAGLGEPPRRKGAATPKTPPPTPPGRSGGNRPRVHVEIVLPDPTPKHKPWLVKRMWKCFFVLFLLMLLGTAFGHAENWTSYQDSWIRRYHSDDGASALSYKQGFTTIFQMTDKHGRTTECRSYKQGWQTITECD